MKQGHVQFSKKIVVSVTVAVTVLCYMSILLMYKVSDTQYMADVIKMYIAYAMVVFASYSGNSIAEKLILHGDAKKLFSGKEDNKDEGQG